MQNVNSSDSAPCCDTENDPSKAYNPFQQSRNDTTLRILPFCKSDNDENAELFQAVGEGNLNEVVKLLNSGVQINIADKREKNNTSLHCAIEEGKTEIIELLLNRGSNITIKNCYDEYPLQLAMESDFEEIVNNVTYRKCNVPADGSCLFWATSLAYLIPVKYNNYHFQIRFEKLFGNEHCGELMRNVQARLQMFNPSLKNVSIFNNEILRHLVTDKLRNRTIDELLSLQSKFESSITVNDIIYSKNEDYILRGTLQENFSREFVNEISQKNINVAIFKPLTLNDFTIEMIDSELEKVQNQEKVKVFKFKAYLECMRKSEAWAGNHEIQAISHILRCNIKIFSDGLQHCISNDDVQESIQLFNNGESHYHFGLIRASLLMEAIKGNNPQNAKTYIKSGIDDPNYEDADGWTLLHYAAQRGFVDVVQSLLNAGANTAIKNFLNQTPLDVASFFKQHDAAALIKKHLQQNGNSSNRSSTDQSQQLCQQNVISTPVADNATSSPVADSKRITFNRRKGTASISGHLYKIELLMHFLLQGINKNKTKEIDGFHLATNIEQTGEFSDVVLRIRYKDPDGKRKSKLIFLLARHRENAEKEIITIDKLFPKLDKGDFDLKKCFKSYCKIKQQFSEVGHPIFETEFNDSDCEFVIYTNSIPDLSQNLNYFRKVSVDQKSLFYVHDIANSNRYYELAFCPNENEKILDILQYSSDSKKLAKALVESLLSSEVMNVDKGVLKEYHIPLAEKVIRREGKTTEGKLREDFLNDEANEFRTTFFEELQKDESYAGKTESELISSLQSRTLNLPDSFGRSKARKGKYTSSLPNDGICRSDVEEFFGKLKLFFGQPNVADLCSLIKKNMQLILNVAEKDVDLLFSDVRSKIERWWKDGSEYITESNQFFQESARISFRFDVRAPEMFFTGRQKELADLHEALQSSKRVDGINVISEIVSVLGLGGIGKSELVRKYIQDHAANYDDNVIWIDAESYSSIVESFRRLSHDKLGISSKAADGREKDIKSIIEEVYRYFHKRKSLFIFDNAEKCDTEEEKDAGIDKFLPPLSVSNEPYILVTSRNSQWGVKVGKVALNEFSEAEAETFIKKYLGIKDELQNNEVKELAKILGYFPLVLQQAVAYILEAKKSESESEKSLIDEYIADYNTEELQVRNLLDFQILNDNEYTATAFITWKITFDKIKQMEYGEEASTIMTMMAYFAPSNIPTKIFLIPILDKMVLVSSFQLLKQYSLISLTQGVANIHKLVQKVTRIRLKQQMKEKEVLRNVLALLELPMKQCNRPIKSTYATHAACAWNYVHGYAELIEEFSELPGFITARLLDGIRYEEAFIFVEKAVHLLSNTLGPLHPNTLTTQGNMALVLDKKGKIDEALSVYNVIVDKFKQTLGTDHPYTLGTMVNRASVLDSQGKYDEAVLVYEEAYGHFKETLGNDHPYTSSVMSYLGGIFYSLGKHKESWEMYQRVLNKQKDILDHNHPSTLNTLSNIANVLNSQGKQDTALKVHKDVLDKRKQILGPDHPFTLETMVSVAILLSEQGDLEAAISILEEVFQERKRVLGLDHPDTLSTMYKKAILLGQKGDCDKALDIFEKVLEVRTQILGTDHPSTLDTLHNMAAAFESQGNYVKALETNSEVLGKRKQVLGSFHPDTLGTKCNLAGLLTTLGKYDESLKTFQELLNERTLSLGPNHPDTLATKSGIAGILYKQGKFKESLKINLDVLENMKQILSLQDPYILSSMRNVALKLETLGEFDEALNTYQLVLDQGQQIFGYDNLLTLNTKNDIGRILDGQGKYEESLKIFEDVLYKRKQILGEDNPSILYTMLNIASVLEKQNNYDEALKLYKKVLKKFEEILGPDHPDTLSTLHNMAVVFDSQGNLEEALKCYNLLIPKFQKVCGSNHLSTLSASINRAVLFSKQHNYADGERELQSILPTLRQILGSKHPSVLTVMSNMAVNLEEQQKYNEALKVYKKLLKKREEVCGPDHHDTLSTEYRISRVLFKKGSYCDALKATQEILDKIQRLFGNDHPYALSAHKNIDIILDKLDETALLRLISSNAPLCDITPLIEAGANVNAQHHDSGETPLLSATENNRKDVVDILLKSGSNASIVAKDGSTLLHIAVLKGFKDIAEALLKHMELTEYDKLCCFVNARTTTNDATALHAAIARGHWDIVELLLKYDADPTILDKDGKTAMDLTMECNHLEDTSFLAQDVSRNNLLERAENLTNTKEKSEKQ